MFSSFFLETLFLIATGWNCPCNCCWHLLPATVICCQTCCCHQSLIVVTYCQMVVCKISSSPPKCYFLFSFISSRLDYTMCQCGQVTRHPFTQKFIKRPFIYHESISIGSRQGTVLTKNGPNSPSASRS